jgi:signal transduction histidine kinase
VALSQWFVTGPLLADCALLISLFSLTLLAPPIRALLGGAVLMLGVVMASLRWVLTGDALKSIVFMTGFVIAALAAGVAARTWRSYSEAQAERTRRLEFERDQQAKLATAAERSRIAREMHDVVAHNVSIMVTLADAALAKADTQLDSAKEAVADVAATGRHALADMRQILGVLSTDAPSTDREPQPQLSGIPPLVDRVRGTGLNVEFGQFGTPFELPPSVQLSIYRIVQESLTNVLKHADDPHEATVNLIFDAPVVEVSVFDDGKHTSAGIYGHGVSGMHERAAFCGGTLTAGRQPGKGWEVRARLRADE